MKRTLVFPLSLLAFLAGCDSEPEITESIRPVEVFTTGSALEHLERNFSGTALSADNVNLSFRVSGELIDFPVRLGQKMQAGNLIGRIDPTDYELQVAQAQAALAQASAQEVNARSEFNRVRQLWENGSVSESDLERVKAADESARAQMDASQQQLALAEKQLSYCTLVAPREGVIAETHVEANQVLRAGQVVVSYLTPESLQVEIGIPENLINDVFEGMAARVEFDALPDQLFKGTITEKGVVVDASATYPVRIELEGSPEGITPGMIAEVVLLFPLPEHLKAIPIPVEAIAGRLDERFVFVYDADTSTVRRQSVVPGRIVENQIFILSGVEPGQVIVKRGVHRLEEGKKVRLLSAAQ